MIHVYLGGFALALTALSMLDHMDKRLSWRESFWNLLGSSLWFIIGPALIGVFVWIVVKDRATVEAKLKAWGMLP